jgi:hypothetical protein
MQATPSLARLFHFAALHERLPAASVSAAAIAEVEPIARDDDSDDDDDAGADAIARTAVSANTDASGDARATAAVVKQKLIAALRTLDNV